MKFPKYAPSNIHCKKCGNSPMEIWAYVYYEKNKETGRKKKEVIPALVCSNKSCLSLFDIMEYDLTEEQLCQ